MFAILFLGAGFFTSCNNSSNSDDEPESPSTPSSPDSPADNSDALEVTLGDFYFWNDASKGSYDSSTKRLTLKNGDGGNGAGFSFKADASSYKYALLSYENLDLSNENFRLAYSNGTYSEVYLYKNATEAYIELDADRKSEITNINFMTRQSEKQAGKETVSITIKKLQFVKEKNSASKTAVVDSGSKTFDDSITALELSDKIALGYSLGCGLNRAPFYNDKNGRKSGYGFQNNYSKDDVPLLMNLEEQKTALGNQAGGMALELDDNPLVTKALIDSAKAKGFKSIRICVTWYPHIIDKNYTIDPDFMARVKEVVDWAVSDGLYVILNEHHSVHAYCPIPLGYSDGYNLTAEDKTESENYLRRVYEQICAVFNGSYDEHLIFETLNEPRIMTADDSKPQVWPPRRSLLDDTGLQEATEILNGYNKLILDTIRKSGGNNAKRFVMIPTYATDYSTVASEYLKLPADSASGKLMVAIHWYPLEFYDSGRSPYSDSKKQEFETVFKAAYDRFISKGVPVTITEFGIENNKDYLAKYNVNISSDYTERLNCLSDFCEIAGKYGLSAMAWDDGGVHAVINRFDYTAYDGDDFIAKLISAWNTGRKSNLVLVPVELSTEDWSKSCEISGELLNGISSSSVLKLTLEKISGAGYSVIRICPENSDVSLDMSSISVSSGTASLIESSNNGVSDGRGKNITLDSDSAVVQYTLSASDCTKIKNAGGIKIFGYGVKIKGAELSE